MRHRLYSGTALWLVPVVVASMAGQVRAQEASAATGSGPTVLKTLMVTATRSSRPVASIPGSVMVLEGEDLQTQLRTTSDAATLISRMVPGFSIANQTISGASETFRGRGVLVLVDGVARNTPLRDVSRVLSLVDLSKVERVEVVNGASSLYGSGGTGGTINFVTKKEASEKASVTVDTKLRVFTHNVAKSASPEISVSATQKIGNFDYLFSASGRKVRRTYDGAGRELPSDAMLGQGGGDRTDFGNLYARLGYEDASRRFEVSGELVRADQKPDWYSNFLATPAVPDFTAPYTAKSVQENSKYLTARFTESDFALGSLEVKGFYNDMEKRFPFTRFDRVVNNQVYYSGNPLDPQAPYSQTSLFSERSGISATVETPLDTLKEGTSLTWGLDFVHDRTWQTLQNGAHVMSPMTQNSVAAFAQLEVPVTERFRVQGGVRYERYFLNVDNFVRPDIYYINRVFPAINVVGGDFNYDNWTFNIGSTFDLTPDTQIYGGFSQGFSLTDIGGFTRRAGANSTAEMCDAYGALVCPGAGLPDYTVSYASIAPDPQVVNNYEVGLRGSNGDFGGSLSAYLSTSDNGVNYNVATNRVSQQKERIWGVEATGWWNVSNNLTVGGILGYTEGRYDANLDGTIDSWLPNNRIATPVHGLVYGTWVFDNGVSLRGEAEFFKGRDKVTTVPEIESAVLFNVLASGKVAGGELSVAVRNLFDNDYMNPTASATRNNVVQGEGRTITVGYKVTF